MNTPACDDRRVEFDLGVLFRPGGRASGWRRMPAVAGEAMIATSHPLATAAGLEAFVEAPVCEWLAQGCACCSRPHPTTAKALLSWARGRGDG